MGNLWSNDFILDEETLLTYVELTYLKRREILCIVKRLNSIEPGILRNDLHHRFTVEQVRAILPQIAHSPFQDSIYRVFSSKQDGCLSLEDVLDLCSAFSENCPENIRAAWAFRILDLDGDNEISADDLIQIVRRLTRNHEAERESIDNAEVEYVARMMPRYQWGLQEIPYSPVSNLVVTAKRRKIDRELALPYNDISSIDVIRMKEVDDLYKVLREIVYNELASISLEDFIHYSSRMPEFSNTFHFKI